jgi:hypothetical protein
MDREVKEAQRGGTECKKGHKDVAQSTRREEAV